MLNVIWLAMVVLALLTGAMTGRLDAVADACGAGAASAVTVAMGLAGSMTLWLGLLGVLREAGLTAALARGLRRPLARLFPELPSDHPALATMALNLGSNLLGMGNAATPVGLRAMRELLPSAASGAAAELFPEPTASASASAAARATAGAVASGTAAGGVLVAAPAEVTPPMMRFLVLNTAGMSLLPTSMLALRASAGSRAPAAMVLPALAGSLAAAAAGLLAVRLFTRGDAAVAGTAGARRAAASAMAPVHAAPPSPLSQAPTPARPRTAGVAALMVGLLATLAFALYQAVTAAAPGEGGAALATAVGRWLVPVLVVAVALWGWARGIAIYDAAVRGGREALTVVAGLLPHLVLLLVAVSMLRAAGVIDALAALLAPAAAVAGILPEALPLALLRPLSGSGAYALAAEALGRHGPDSPAGLQITALMASSETTLYILALYGGAAGVAVGRRALASCLLGEAAGVLTACWACRLLG